jgi:DNA helicase-2/ATP-dependent DNA helicase PcrA
MRLHSNSPKFKPLHIVPSDEQLDIQTATDKIILIDADAGAAKTTTLALRIAESLKRGVHAEHVLILTVTVAAQQSIRDRLLYLGVPYPVVSRIQISTFEQFASQSLEKIEGYIPQIIKEKEGMKRYALEALDKVSEMYRDKYDLDISTTNSTLDNFFKVQTRIKATLKIEQLDIDLATYLPDEIESLLKTSLTNYLWFTQYEKKRIDSFGDVQFRMEGDASYDFINLMAAPDFESYLLPNFKIIACDEMHDLSEVTFSLLTKLIMMNNAFFVGAGDKDQVIFSWKGSDHSILQSKFYSIFKNTKAYKLTKSYRYGPSLAQAVSSFKNKQNVSGSDWNTAINVIDYDHQEQQQCALKTVNLINKWRSTEENHGTSVAVLLRHAGQSLSIENELLDNNIQYQMDGISSFLSRPEILMFRGILSLSLGSLDTILYKKSRSDVFDALVTFGEIPITAEFQKSYWGVREDAIQQANALEWFYTNILGKTRTSSAAAIQTCTNHIRSLGENASSHSALQFIRQSMDLEAAVRRIYIDRNDATFVQHSIDEFIRLAQRKNQSIGDFMQWLGKLELKIHAKQGDNKLFIACADDIKGKEFDFVILPYMERLTFPRSTFDDEERMDEENRFYVAITRAKKQLTLLTPGDQTYQSPYLQALRVSQSVREGRRIFSEYQRSRD